VVIRLLFLLSFLLLCVGAIGHKTSGSRLVEDVFSAIMILSGLVFVLACYVLVASLAHARKARRSAGEPPR
jgi:hypothetical protein